MRKSHWSQIGSSIRPGLIGPWTRLIGVLTIGLQAVTTLMIHLFIILCKLFSGYLLVVAILRGGMVSLFKEKYCDSYQNTTEEAGLLGHQHHHHRSPHSLGAVM